MTSTGPSDRAATAQILVSWSRTTMTAATASGPTGDRRRQRRRSSRDLHSMHSAANGRASRRATAIFLPHRSQIP